jgi:carboxylesterase type B
MLNFVRLLQLAAAQCYSGRIASYKGAKLYTGVDGITAFLGVPNAEPPIGKLRFKQIIPFNRELSGDIRLDTLPPKFMKIISLSR